MLDVLCIIERNGARTPLKDVPVKRLPSLQRFYGRQIWGAGLQYNLITALLAKTNMMRNQIQPEMLLGDIFSIDELHAEAHAARITTNASTVTLPIDIERNQRGLWPGLPAPVTS